MAGKRQGQVAGAIIYVSVVKNRELGGRGDNGGAGGRMKKTERNARDYD